jgi:hypothetical protein
LEDLGLDGRVILKLFLNRCKWTVLMWLRIGAGGRCCEDSNETSGFINCMEFLD